MTKTNLSFWVAKRKISLIVLLLLGVIFAIYNEHRDSLVLFSKGQFIMNDHLVPEHIPVSCGVSEIKNLPGQDKFALINGHNEFAIATLMRNGDLKVHTILDNYPNRDLEGSELEGLYTDDEGKFYWSIAIRGIFGVNFETKKTFDPLFAFNGNTSLLKTKMIDIKNEIILGEVIDYQLHTVTLVKYDCKNDLLGKPSKAFEGAYYFFRENQLLWCETLESVHKVKWHLCDFDFENLQYNKLTDELTKKQIMAFEYGNPISVRNRIILGSIEIKAQETYYSIRWNREMTEVKIEPLVLQIPPNGWFESLWFFSDDGLWLAATFTNAQSQERRIVFFSVNDSYPQGLSAPIFGEGTLYEKDGAFVNHSELGPLYLDRSPKFENALLVYKLNDALKILREKEGGK